MLSLPEFVAGEIPEAVVSGVLISFTERRVVKDLLDEFVDGETFVQDS